MNSKEEPPGIKLTGTTVYISNLSEDVWPFISNISDSQARENEIEENAYLSDRNLFSLVGEDRIVLITPAKISPEFIEYFKSLFGKKKQIEIIVPSFHSGKICEDIIKDEKVVNDLIRIANSVKKLTLISYTNSPYFFNLIRFLKSRGIEVYTPEAPSEEDAWTVNFFGSKSGIRQVAQMGSAKEPDLIMPEGVIVSGIADAAKIAAKKYIKENGVVIKTNKGHAGMGLMIFRPGDLPASYEEANAEILKRMQEDAYWEKFPIIIESLVRVNQNMAGGFPNVEFKIQKSGKIEFLYFGGMRITKDGVFKGMEINDSVLDDRIETQMIDTGFYIAEQYAANGYRGYFDVDFIAGKNGKLYVTESNVRMTGGTHVHAIAEALFDKDYIYDTYIISNNIYSLPKKGKKYDFAYVKEALKPILFNKKTKEGLIVAFENLLKQNKLGYVIFGKNKKRALEIESKMEALLTFDS